MRLSNRNCGGGLPTSFEVNPFFYASSSWSGCKTRTRVTTHKAAALTAILLLSVAATLIPGQSAFTDSPVTNGKITAGSVDAPIVIYSNNFDSNIDWTSWSQCRSDWLSLCSEGSVKQYPGFGSLELVSGQLRRSGDAHARQLGAESPQIPIKSSYTAFTVQFRWHAHSNYQGSATTNMFWGILRSDGQLATIDQLAHGGAYDISGTVNQDIISQVQQAASVGCTWVKIEFWFGDDWSYDWGQYNEIDDVLVSVVDSVSAPTGTLQCVETLTTLSTSVRTTETVTSTNTRTRTETVRTLTVVNVLNQPQTILEVQTKIWTIPSIVTLVEKGEMPLSAIVGSPLFLVALAFLVPVAYIAGRRKRKTSQDRTRIR